MNFQHLCGPGKTAAERFAEYVMPVPESGCHIFLGQESHNGYGRFQPNGRRKVAAHRYAWLQERGEIPAGLMLCHKCDTPQCCNVDHLFLGTCKENKQDSVRKGRHSHGRPASEAKRKTCNPVLTEETARQVFNAEGTHQSIADRMGIKRQLVTKVKAKKIWSWIHSEAA